MIRAFETTSNLRTQGGELEVSAGSRHAGIVALIAPPIQSPAAGCTLQDETPRQVAVGGPRRVQPIIEIRSRSARDWSNPRHSFRKLQKTRTPVFCVCRVAPAWGQSRALTNGRDARESTIESTWQLYRFRGFRWTLFSHSQCVSHLMAAALVDCKLI
jgi:hypothetical protein